MRKFTGQIRGDRVASRRKQAGLSQTELAEKLMVGQNTVSKYERDMTDPSAETLALMAGILDTTTDYLLGLTDYPEREIRRIDDLSAKERELLALYRTLSDDDQRRILNMIKVF